MRHTTIEMTNVMKNTKKNKLCHSQHTLCIISYGIHMTKADVESPHIGMPLVNPLNGKNTEITNVVALSL